MQKIKSFLKGIMGWFGSHPTLERAAHTAWQALLGFVLAHWTVPHSTQDVQLLFTGGYASVLSALKTFALNYLQGRRS